MGSSPSRAAMGSLCLTPAEARTARKTFMCTEEVSACISSHTLIRHGHSEAALLQQAYRAGQGNGENLFSSPRILGRGWEPSPSAAACLFQGHGLTRGRGGFGRMANLRFSLITNFCGAELQHSVKHPTHRQRQKWSTVN